MRNRRRDSASPEHGAPIAEPAGTPVRQPLSSVEAQFAKELFERYQFQLLRYLKGMVHSPDDAKELLQETYLRLLRQPSFEHVRENARAYLFTTARNLARDLFRARAIRGMEAGREAIAASGLDSPHWDDWPEFALEGELIARLVFKALESLDVPVRTALLLHRFRGLTQQQIATRLGVSERTVERYLKEGLSRIASQIGGVP